MATKKSENAPEQSNTLSMREYQKLDVGERLLRMAERNVELYGSLEPPKEVLVLSLKKKCPKCPRIGGVELFGTRKAGTELQSYCKHCRNEPGMRGNGTPRTAAPKIFTREMRRLLDPKQREIYMKLYDAVFAKLPKTEQEKAERGRW
jgi:hypothetical protein